MEGLYGFPVKGKRSYRNNPNQLLNPNGNSNSNSNPNPNPNPNPNYNQFLDPFYIPNPYGNYYYNPNSQPNPYRDHPYQNPNSQPNQYPRDHPYHNSNAHINQSLNHYYNSSNAARNPSPKPKVVNIPIKFAGSEEEEEDSRVKVRTRRTAPKLAAELAAVRIQKLVRGFLARKNWGELRRIEVEAEAIREEIVRDEAVLERDAKARVRVGESLMGLLLRLDSIRGVRDYRKKVIRKVISLQELVDSIGTRGQRSDLEVDTVAASTEQNSETVPTEEKEMEESPVDLTFGSELIESSEKSPDSSSSSVEDFVMVEPVESVVDSTIIINSVESAEEEKLGEESDVVCNPIDQASESSPDQAVTSNKNSEMEMKEMREAMERVLSESERMKRLMEELCQSSTRQWSLVEGLVDRVRRIEKEVAKMEKKGGGKKKRGSGKKSDGCCKKSDDL